MKKNISKKCNGKKRDTRMCKRCACCVSNKLLSKIEVNKICSPIDYNLEIRFKH